MFHPKTKGFLRVHVCSWNCHDNYVVKLFSTLIISKQKTKNLVVLPIKNKIHGWTDTTGQQTSLWPDLQHFHGTSTLTVDLVNWNSSRLLGCITPTCNRLVNFWNSGFCPKSLSSLRRRSDVISLRRAQRSKDSFLTLIGNGLRGRTVNGLCKDWTVRDVLGERIFSSLDIYEYI